MTVTWKALAYSSEVTSSVTSEGVVRSTADSSLVLVASTADSKAVSAASIALSYTNSEITVRSTADSSIVAIMASSASVSTADSKAVSAASIALSYTNSEAVIRSAADSSLTIKAINTFGAATGAVGMSGNQLTDQVIHSVSNTTSLTALTPVVAKFAFNAADLSAYICTSAI